MKCKFNTAFTVYRGKKYLNPGLYYGGSVFTTFASEDPMTPISVSFSTEPLGLPRGSEIDEREGWLFVGLFRGIG